MNTYKHPTAGELPLVPHPTKPWRVVGYLDGRAVIEMDAPAPDPVREPEPPGNSGSVFAEYVPELEEYVPELHSPDATASGEQSEEIADEPES